MQSIPFIGEEKYTHVFFFFCQQWQPQNSKKAACSLCGKTQKHVGLKILSILPLQPHR
ncbi:hypothetical protein Dimus_037961 [Dionaea muscipula]